MSNYDCDLFFYGGGRNRKALLNEMFGRMYCDTDGIIKLKEVNNNMKDWLVVHSYIDGTLSIIKKDSITFVGTSFEGTTVIHTLNYTYEVSEKYVDIVRRIVE